ncbi:MAG TPA: TcpQ domain-containing protein, partial [Alphaproteobacteria bacterium]|nr:TcpQ domain-containing protein [Alphaproteobacteria bacterium]
SPSPMAAPQMSQPMEFAPPARLAEKAAAFAEKGETGALPAPPSRFPDAIGFGRDVPLAMALRQVVPPSYGFSFADGVDQGQRVSWAGGKPWDQALDAALRPKGLGASISGNAVHIAPLPASMTPISPMSPRPSAAPRRDDSLTPLPPSGVANAEALPRFPQTTPPRSAMRGVDAELLPDPVPLQASAGDPTPLMQTPASAGFPKGLVKSSGPMDMPAVSNRSEPLQPIPLSSPAPVPLNAQGTPAVPLTPEDPMAMTTPAAGMASVSPPISRKSAIRPGSFDMNAVQEWSAPAGATLRRVLTDWSEKAGVQLHWSSQFDYPIQAHIQMTATYQKAVESLLDGLRDAKPRPLARLHPNLPAGPAILILQTQQVIN